MRRLTVGSLFSGIGGLDKGLEDAGMVCKWQVEIDDYATKVLERHWPSVTRFRDIRECGVHNLETVDLICGGFPCQPVSLAGKRQAQSDPRWLWPEFARILDELRPRFALLENVPGLITAGASEVLADLATLGYDAEWDCIPAAAFGAPHRRYRVFIVAYAQSNLRRTSRDDRSIASDRSNPFLAYACGERRQQESRSALGDEATNERRSAQDYYIFAGDGQGGQAEDMAHANRLPRGYGHNGASAILGSATQKDEASGQAISEAEWRTAQSSLGMLANGISPRLAGSGWLSEPRIERVAIGVPDRVAKLRCLGNAVVPAVAQWLGERIVERDKKLQQMW